MAEHNEKKKRLKNAGTIRERAIKSSESQGPRRLRRTATGITKPLRAAHKVGKQEYYLPMPNNRFGRVLNKRVHLLPRFLINAWREVRLVEWPGRKETVKLTIAVFTFAIVFGAIISITDYGLDNLFKKVLIK